jgi:hypothetical protein
MCAQEIGERERPSTREIGEQHGEPFWGEQPKPGQLVSESGGVHRVRGKRR